MQSVRIAKRGQTLSLVLWGLAGLWSYGAQAAPAPLPAVSQNPVHLVCVEAVWCSIAQQVGGALIQPDVLISTEGLDPHHLQATPSMARRLAGAQSTLINGATYDDWALSLAKPDSGRIVVAELAQWKDGEDPHLFFSPAFVLKTAHAIADWLTARFPKQKEQIANRLLTVEHQVAQVESRLAVLKAQDPAAPVALLEPAGARLMKAAGLDITDPRWAQMAMEGNGGSPQETASLATELDQRKVRFLVVNPTLDSPSMAAMAARARKAGVPIVKIGESLPAGMDWAQWMNQILDEMTLALRVTHGPALPALNFP